jgi:hypothetical protein
MTDVTTSSFIKKLLSFKMFFALKYLNLTQKRKELFFCSVIVLIRVLHGVYIEYSNMMKLQIKTFLHVRCAKMRRFK